MFSLNTICVQREHILALFLIIRYDLFRYCPFSERSSMNKFRIRKHTIHTTERGRKWAAWMLPIVLKYFFYRRKFWKHVLARHAKATGLPRHPVTLCAHGKVRDRRWYFWDQQRRTYRLVQSWIDEHDGEATALLLFCCNSSNAEIHAEKSLVIHLNCSARIPDLWLSGRLRLFHPTFGYIENNYYRLRQILRR